MAVTVLTLRESLERGRLRTYPVVDNVIYMASGAKLLEAARAGGVRGAISAYVESPPHAPYSTLSAALGYAIFGPRDIGPHIAAGIVPLIGLLAVWWVLRSRGLRPWERVAILVVVACMPIWANSVEYLKPDLCCGLLAALGSVMLLARPPGRLDWRPVLASGALFGLALLAKPAVFPQTLWFMFAAFGARAIMDRMVGERMFTLRRVVQGLVLAGVAIALATPHYLLVFSRITRYINEIMFGSQRTLWEYRGSVIDHALFHLTGRGGRQFLAVPGWIVLGIVSLAAVVSMRRCGRAQVAMAVGWGVLLVATYLPPAVNHFKNPQFAACFQFLVGFGGVLGCVLLLKRVRQGMARSLAVVTLAIVCLATAEWTFPRYAPAELPIVDARMVLVQEIYDVASGDRRTPRTLLVAGPLGHINQNLFTLWCVRDRNPLRTTLLRAPLSGAALDARLAEADYVLVSEGETAMVSTTVAKPGIAEHLMGEMRARAAWRSVRRFPAPGAPGYFELFARRTERAVSEPVRSVDDAEETWP